MGCGSSSLKGEDVNVNGPTPTSVAPKRVNTNFASVDYDQDGNQGRRMTEYAPHETVKAKKSHEVPRSVASGRPSEANDGTLDTSPLNSDKVLAADPLTSMAGIVTYPHEGAASAGLVGEATQNVELKPYKTNGDEGWDEDNLGKKNGQQATTTSAVNGTGTEGSDPTTFNSKRNFAHENDPASLANQESHRHKENHHLHPGSRNGTTSAVEQDSDAAAARKKSWLGDKYSQYNAAKHGKNVTLSDEDLKKYTGKNRQELDEWAEGQGVGPNQPAARYRGEGTWGGGG